MRVTILFILLFTFIGCDESLNIYTVEDDITLGQKLSERIDQSSEYEVLNEFNFSDLYLYLYQVKEEILISPYLNFSEKFVWELKIINDDNKIDAFSLPGGYLYIYSGMLKYIENVDQLAALLAHMIVHCDQRFDVNKLAQVYGYQELMNIVENNVQSSELDDILSDIENIPFNIDEEKSIDASTVELLTITRYSCASFIDLINRLETTNNNFLDNHVDPKKRINIILEKVTEMACDTTMWHNNGDNGAFATAIATLP